MFAAVDDTALVIGGVAEVFETSTVTSAFIVSSLGKGVLLTEDAEMVDESAVVVTSSTAVVITLLKFVAAFSAVFLLEKVLRSWKKV